jgi:hypothetical protein
LGSELALGSEALAIVEKAREDGRLQALADEVAMRLQNPPIELPAPTLGGGLRPEDVSRTPKGAPIRTLELQRVEESGRILGAGSSRLNERPPTPLPFGRRLESPALLDEVGRILSPNVAAKDPFSQRTKQKIQLADRAFPPQKYKNPRTGRWEYSRAKGEEITVKGRLKEFMDPLTRFIPPANQEEAIRALRALDVSKGGSARFSAVLRTLRGSDPAFVQKVIDQMPKARRAWEWTLAHGSEDAPSKFEKNENWLMTTTDFSSNDPAFKLAKRAHNYSIEAFKRGDLMGADLASSAVWSVQNNMIPRARYQLEQAKAWSRVEPMTPEWLEYFNPKAEEWLSPQGAELELTPENDLRIARIVPVEEARPDAAVLNAYGRKEVEWLPEASKEYLLPRTKRGKIPKWFLKRGETPSDWFKLMEVNREVENELVRRGMPPNIVGTKKAVQWAQTNDPSLGDLYGLFHEIKSGKSGREVLASSGNEVFKAQDILDLLLDDEVRPPLDELGEEEAGFRPGMADRKAMNRARGGANVNRWWEEPRPSMPALSLEEKAARYGKQAAPKALAKEARMISSWEEFAALGKKLLGKATRIL